MDDGSSENCLSIEAYRHIPEDVRPPLQESQTVLRSAGGSGLQVYGNINLPVYVGKKAYLVSFVVCAITEEAILGKPFLRRNKVVVMHHLCKIKIDSEIVPCFDKWSRPLNATIRVGQTVTIDSGQEYIVPGKVYYRSGRNRRAMVLGNSSFMSKNEVLVARVLVDPQVIHRQVPLRLFNVGNKAVTLQEGSLIAQLHSVTQVLDDISSTNNIKTESEQGVNVPEHLKDLFERSKSELNSEQENKLAELLNEYSDVFSTGSKDIGHTTLTKHDIETVDEKPVKFPPRYMSQEKQDDANAQIQQSIETGIARPSNSPWAAPVVMVRKKDGSYRMCVDYRSLNDKTIKDAYPLPKIQEVLDTLSGSRLYSTLDLASGYWQVDLTERAREKSAFCTRNGLFEWLVMPFGLCNAPATFERLMERVLGGLNWKICLIYLDDVIVISKSVQDMFDRLRQIFDRLRSANLKLKPSKCHLFQTKVQYLGHIISAEGIATDPEKVSKVCNWPTPTNVHEVRQFTGLINYYRRFLPHLSSIAQPLYELTNKKHRFNWTVTHQEAFTKLKEALVNAPILSYPNDKGLMVLDTDASNDGLGCVLSQVQNDHERVLAYGSRSLSKEERNYCVTRKELLAVVHFVKQFRQYLLGRKFLIRTDHSSLRWLLRMKNTEGQLARFLEVLSEYDFVIEHRPGKNHQNADALSRRPCRQSCPCKMSGTNAGLMSDKGLQCNIQDKVPELPGEYPHIISEAEVSTVESVRLGFKDKDEVWLDCNQVRSVFKGWSMSKLREAQEEDSDIAPILKFKQKGWERPKHCTIAHFSLASKSYWAQWNRLEVKEGVLLRRFWSKDGSATWMQVILPRNLRQNVLEQLHDSPSGGHLGFDKTFARIQKRFSWYKCKDDVELYLKTCIVCAKFSRPSKTPRATMGTVRSGAPMERIACDIMGPLQETENHNRYILVVQDYFTKYVEAYPLPSQEAKVIADVIVNQWISRYGAPYELHTDCGSNFESKLFQEVLNLLGIEKTRTTPYNAKSDGMVERFNATLQNILACTADSCHWNWDNMIPLALMAYRASPNASTGITPNMALYGREIKEPLDVAIELPHEQETIDLPEYVVKLRENLVHAHETVREATGQATKRAKREYDKKVCQNKFQVGDPVWIHIKGTKRPSAGKVSKFLPKYEGPYFITMCLDPHVFIVKQTARSKAKVIHHDRLKPYKCRELLDNSWVFKQTSAPVEIPFELDTDDDLSDSSESAQMEDLIPNPAPPRPVPRPRRSIKPPQRYGDWVTDL
jgi:dUTPase